MPILFNNPAEIITGPLVRYDIVNISQRAIGHQGRNAKFAAVHQKNRLVGFPYGDFFVGVFGRKGVAGAIVDTEAGAGHKGLMDI